MNQQRSGFLLNEEQRRCVYCHTRLPEEPEEIRRVFERGERQSTTWGVYRCTNPDCLRRTFVIYQPQQVLPTEKRGTHENTRDR